MAMPAAKMPASRAAVCHSKATSISERSLSTGLGAMVVAIGPSVRRIQAEAGYHAAPHLPIMQPYDRLFGVNSVPCSPQDSHRRPSLNSAVPCAIFSHHAHAGPDL